MGPYDPMQGRLKSGDKTPPQIGPAFDPSYQPDVAQFADETDAAAATLVPFSDAHAQAALTPASASRIQCDYTPYIFNASLFGSVLLVPRNLNRSNVFLINRSVNPIMVSFGKPLRGNPLDPHVGFKVAANSFFSEKNGVTGVDDLWITSGFLFAPVFHIVAYEGVPVLENAA